MASLVEEGDDGREGGCSSRGATDAVGGAVDDDLEALAESSNVGRAAASEAVGGLVGCLGLDGVKVGNGSGLPRRGWRDDAGEAATGAKLVAGLLALVGCLVDEAGGANGGDVGRGGRPGWVQLGVQAEEAGVARARVTRGKDDADARAGNGLKVLVDGGDLRRGAAQGAEGALPAVGDGEDVGWVLGADDLLCPLLQVGAKVHAWWGACVASCLQFSKRANALGGDLLEIPAYCHASVLMPGATPMMY